MPLERLRKFLKTHGPATAKELCHDLKISQPTFSRLSQNLRDEIIIGGEARNTRYALRQKLPAIDSPIPIYKIDEKGKPSLLADLHPIQPKGFFVESRAEKLPSEWFEDLPFFLEDLRPNGFLGRMIPKRHPELSAPSDIRLWTSQHCLAYWIRFESDGIGNLIIGKEAFQKHLASLTNPTPSIPAKARSRLYPKLAQEVLSLGPAGSSAGGEQPKFLTVRGPHATPVIVKFSPQLNEGVGRRIADLLICEHLAHRVLLKHDVAVPQSALVKGNGQIFLEMERFDRIIPNGRRGLLSLGTLSAQFSGKLGNWAEMGFALRREKIITEETAQQIDWLENFGSLIANTDRHPGNLAFYRKEIPPFALAPVYDMLPMLYYPQYGQLLTPPFHPTLPSPEAVRNWKGACDAAEDFWRMASSHPEISKEFQKIAKENTAKIQSLD